MSHGQASQIASLRLFMVPAYGQGPSRNFLDTKFCGCMQWRSSARKAAFNIFFLRVTHLGGQLVCLTNAIDQPVFIVSELGKRLFVESELDSLFQKGREGGGCQDAKAGMAALRITYFGSWT